MTNNKRKENIKNYLSILKNFSVLNKEEEIFLARLVSRGDQQAKQKFIKSNLRLVVYAALKCKCENQRIEDIIQEGNIGLIYAVEKFDWKKGVRFSTYAMHWIQHSINRSLVVKNSVIRIPKEKIDTINRIKQVENYLGVKLQRAPSINEVANKANLSKSEVVYFKSLDFDESSLDESIAKYNGDFYEYLADYTYEPQSNVCDKLYRQSLYREIDKLEKIEKQILLKRFPLNGKKKETLESISKSMNLGIETVRKIESKAKSKLKKQPSLSNYNAISRNMNK